jgi:sugar phosphate isomerase/epimerase
MISRRAFLERSSLALAAMTCLPAQAASGTGPLGRAVGLQLYTVRQDAARDLTGTLAQIASIGYREVETAGFYDKPAKELRKLFADLGLSAPSVHHSMQDLQKDLEAKIDYAAALGAKYFVCAFPALPGGAMLPAGGTGKTIANGMTLDDWKWNADQLNRIGALTRKAGLTSGYHNHNMEFRSIDGKVAYDQLLAWTDPALVTMEMDVGWVVTAGADPVQYLRKHPERFSLLHVKDVRRDAVTVADALRAQTTEVGHGKVDWKELFAAANPQALKHYFVEQENFERPVLDSVRMSYEYLSTLKV